MTDPNLPPLAIANSGIAFWGQPPADVILIATGLTRSQTTRTIRLLAGLSTLRVFDGGNPVSREDDAFFLAIEAGRVEEVAATVAGRGPRWAAKRPRVWHHAATLRAACGPRLAWLFVTRDLAAVAFGEWLANGGSLDDWLADIADDAHEMATAVLAIKEPKAILSAEKLCLHPLQIQHLLQDWLNEPRTYDHV